MAHLASSNKYLQTQFGVMPRDEFQNAN